MKMQNFISVGNAPLVILLNKSQTTLITAPNGTGKSILLDALCFCLFGKAYRNINKPNLINSINQKKCTVEIGFSIGSHQYRVVRGIKPNIFEIYDGANLINQDPNIKDYQKVLEQQLIKMNYRAFTQVVVMGSAAYVPFMKLTTQNRREFIEDLLDIRVFSVMNKLLAAQIKTTKDDLLNIERDITTSKEIIKVIESHLAEKIATAEEKKSLLLEEKKKTQLEIKKYEEEQQNVKKEIAEKTLELESYNSQQDVLIDISVKRKRLLTSILSLEEDLKHQTETLICPACTQNIPHDVRSGFVARLQSRIDESHMTMVELNSQEDLLRNSLSGVVALNNDISSLNTRYQALNEEVYGNTLMLKKVNRQLLEIEDELSVDAPDKSKLKSVAKNIVALDRQKRILLERQQIQSGAHLMLQDSGIKAKIVKQYVPTINKLVNKYLNQLDLFVNFNLDENFNEIIKSRHRDTFTYDSFSQGEKTRIDMALIFCWRAIAASKNSINTNLIILDEIVDSSMDGGGMDQCIGLLNSMISNNIFVVSHREAIADKFSATLRLEKKNNFTQLQV